MDVLSPEYRLPEHLDRLTDPDLDLRRVKRIVPVAQGGLLVALDKPGKDALFLLEKGSEKLKSIGGFESVDEVWPAGPDGVVVQTEKALWQVDADGQKGKLIDLPKGVVSLDAAWQGQGLLAVALVDRCASPDPDAPRFYPAVREKLTLCRYTPADGWRDLAEAPAGSGGLSMSKDGRRMMWRAPLNVVPEEAQRGEFTGYDVDAGEIRALTEGAGRVRRGLMAPDGSGLVYQANHEVQRPITTHTDLWWMSWEGEERRNLTGGGRCILGFAWAGDGDLIWVCTAEGLELKSGFLCLDGTFVAVPGELVASGPVARVPGGAAAFETEGPGEFPAIWTGDRRVALPQAEAYKDLRAVGIRWTAPDGLDIEGVVYEADDTPADAPLLVAAHGGPAAPVAVLRSGAVRHRFFLRAGYRVFQPAFRGSLGFGDAFAQGNIGCQGEADLEDILSGIGHLVETGLAEADRVGIFGGSYGGYMTLRALAVTDRFRAGVALFGFVHNRWMTLETGDFTYETEYIGTVSWPLSPGAGESDVFPLLGQIGAPLLMLHGDQDPICPLSQSMVVYRALEDRKVPTGVVVYPGEGHGFKRKENRRDSARRTLGWFLEHLPLEKQ